MLSPRAHYLNIRRPSSTTRSADVLAAPRGASIPRRDRGFRPPRVLARIDRVGAAGREFDAAGACAGARYHLALPREKAMRHVEAQRAIDLELFLRKELIARGFVRKAVVAPRVVPDVV